MMDLIDRVLTTNIVMMKKVLLVFGMLLSFGLFCACSSDDEMNGNGSNGTPPLPEDSLVAVHNYTGLLCYEECFKSWVISYYHSGSIDWIDIYFPLNLPDVFNANKEAKVNVSFSGEVVEMPDEDIKSKKIPVFGGYHYYYISLEKIEEIK